MHTCQYYNTKLQSQNVVIKAVVNNADIYIHDYQPVAVHC